MTPPSGRAVPSGRGRRAADGPPDVILDAGLQPERTQLAWRRTVLSLVVGGLVAWRVLPPAIGWYGVAAGAAGIAASMLLAVLATRRAAAVASELRAGRPLPPAGGLLAVVAVLVAVGAAVGLVAVGAITVSRSGP